MSQSYTIGQLAKAASIPSTTIRYYERNGIFHPDERSQGNYRLYSPAALGRLQFILAAKANGFTLADVSSLLRFRDGSLAPCQEVRELIEGRLEDVKKRMAELVQIEKILKSLRRTCIKYEKTGKCAVMVKLQTAQSNPYKSISQPRKKKS